MRPQHDFASAQRAALHCEQLIAREPQASGALAVVARFGKALAPRFAAGLGAVFADPGWEAQPGAPEQVLARELAGQIDPVAGNFLLPVGDAGGRLFASFRLPPIMARLEAMFGGETTAGGETGASLPAPGARLPSSLVLVLRRLEGVLTTAVLDCLDEAVQRRGETAEFATDLARLAVFPGQSDAVIVPLRFVSDTSHPPIEVMLGCRPATMARLLAHFQGEIAPQDRTIPATLPAVLGEIPVPLRALLAELKLPASRLLSLKPGQTLPLAIGRSVPLLADGRTLATGVIGEQDDRVALQIDRVLTAGGKG